MKYQFEHQIPVKNRSKRENALIQFTVREEETYLHIQAEKAEVRDF